MTYPENFRVSCWEQPWAGNPGCLPGPSLALDPLEPIIPLQIDIISSYSLGLFISYFLILFFFPLNFQNFSYPSPITSLSLLSKVSSLADNLA